MHPYVLSPDIYGNEVIFVHNDDLWIMSTNGGKARRITNGVGVINNARFSPDGKTVAFRAMYGEDCSFADIFAVRREGGTVRRITYLSGKSTSRRMFTDVAGWSDSGKIIISTDAFSPFTSMTFLYETDPETGLMKPMNLGQASHILFYKDRIIIGRNTNDMLHWKGYKGGTRGKIWSGDRKKGFRKIIDLEGMVSSPVVCDGSLYFVSDHEGHGQIYRSDLDGGNVTRVTNYKDHYPRHLASDGRRIVFTMAGDLYILDPKTEKVEKMVIDMDYSVSTLLPKFQDSGKYLEEFAISPDADEISMTIRGFSFVTGNNVSPVLRIPSEFYRTRNVEFVDGKTMAFVSDKGNRECLYLYDLKDGKSRINSDTGVIESIYPSPDGKYIAVTTDSFDLFMISTDDMKSFRMDKNELGRITDVTWSPDSQFIAYTFPTGKEFLGGHENSCIKLASVKERKTVKVTSDDMRDFSPSFSADGNFLFYLSNRSLDPVGDQAIFTYGFPTSIKPFFVTLKKGIISPFSEVPKDLSLSGPENINIYGANMYSGTVPVDAAEYHSVVALKGGILLHRFDTEGGMKALASADYMRSGRLEFFDFSRKTTKTLAEKVVDYTISAKRKGLLFKASGNNLHILTIDDKESETKFKDDREIDPRKVRITVLPEMEWKQIFLEAWRLACENHWNPDFVKKNGEKILKKYADLEERVTTRFELSDILREMQGEFGTSHSYEMGGDLSSVKAVITGKLGADLSLSGHGYRIDRIYSGDPFNDNEKSPLISANAGIEEGDVVVSVDSVKLDEEHSPYKELLNRAGDLILMEFLKKNGKKIKAYVRPLNDERYLRYRSWVEEKRKYVHEKTGNRIGYVHIPDMGLMGYTEFYRLFLMESSYDGLIVDIRYNGGGHVSQLLLEKVARTRLGYDKPRRGKLGPYPGNSVNGPRVAITNEYAGSDGDVFGQAFKMLELGPLIGTRSWGGVVGINPRRKMVDGTIMTQPEFALWFRDIGYGVENYGVEPTDPVEYPPDSYLKNEDPQLDYAIKKIMTMLESDRRRVVFSENGEKAGNIRRSRRNKGS